MKGPLLSIHEEKVMKRFVSFVSRHHKLVKNFVIYDTYYDYRIFYYFFEDVSLMITFIGYRDDFQIKLVSGAHIEYYDNTPCIFYDANKVTTKWIRIEKPSDNTPKPNKS